MRMSKMFEPKTVETAVDALACPLDARVDDAAALGKT